MKKIFLLLVALFIGVQCAPAQEFTLNAWGWDMGKVECCGAEKSDSGWVVNYTVRVEFEDGFKLNSFAKTVDENNYYVFSHGGKYYAAYEKDLAFSPENPEGVENPLSEKIQRRATRIGKLYGSMEATYLILIIFAVATVIGILYLTTKSIIFRPLFLVVIPVAILLVSVIAIYGFLCFEEDFLWWCDMDKLGFWGALVCLIPFGLLLYTLYRSISIYEKGLLLNSKKSDESNAPEKKISVKPAAIGICVSIPLAFTVLAVLAANGHQHEWYFEPLVLGIFFVTLGIGLLISLKRNIVAFGLFFGILITLFLIVYIVGCIIFTGAAIVLAFEVLLQILMVIGAIIMLMIIGPKRRFRGSDGRIYEEI